MPDSFFATLRAELVDHEQYSTAEVAERSIGDYIEKFYNVERLHSHLDYVSPIEFALKMSWRRLRHRQTVHRNG